MKWLKYCIYISFIFFIYALYRNNYFFIPQIHSAYWLVISLIYLNLAFVLNAVSWQKTLIASTKMPISFSNSVASVGLSIFTKYIPGKVWLILGRAAYMSKMTGIPASHLASLSLTTQLLVMWTGLTFGATGLLLANNFLAYGSIILPMWLLLTFGIFSPWAHRSMEKVLSFVLKRNIALPQLRFSSTFDVLPWYCAYWTCYCIGFYTLIQAIHPEPFSPLVAFAFPLAGTLGLMAVIAPGGIGVREGILVAYLVVNGFDKETAITISLVARMWYLTGEICIFLLGFLMHKFSSSSESCSNL